MNLRRRINSHCKLDNNWHAAIKTLHTYLQTWRIIYIYPQDTALYKIHLYAKVCVYVFILWPRERFGWVGTSKQRWSPVLPSDKAGKLLSAITDLSLTPRSLSSRVVSFASDLFLWVTEERPLKKTHYRQIRACLLNLPGSFGCFAVKLRNELSYNNLFWPICWDWTGAEFLCQL